MHACVRFLRDADNRLHVIPVGTIHNFSPKSEDDFSNRISYEAFWVDEVDGSNTGDYAVQILLLGGTLYIFYCYTIDVHITKCSVTESEAAVREKMKNKRVPRPPLPESEDSSEEDLRSQKKTSRKVSIYILVVQIKKRDFLKSLPIVCFNGENYLNFRCQCVC